MADPLATLADQRAALDRGEVSSRELVDSACEEIMGGRLNRQEATVLAQRVRRQAQEIIPDLMDNFDLIYKSRFERLISQYITVAGAREGTA